jgi:uncharacterized membrane protein YqjE
MLRQMQHKSLEQNSEAPTSLVSAVLNLMSSRFEIISLEAKEARQIYGKKTIIALVFLLSAFLGWIGLLTGIVGLIQTYTKYPWWAIALIISSIHFTIAIVGFFLLRKKSPPAFIMTRKELQEDRKWIYQINKPSL